VPPRLAPADEIKRQLLDRHQLGLPAERKSNPALMENSPIAASMICDGRSAFGLGNAMTKPPKEDDVSRAPLKMKPEPFKPKKDKPKSSPKPPKQRIQRHQGR
jgi:hypothetical protein